MRSVTVTVGPDSIWAPLLDGGDNDWAKFKCWIDRKGIRCNILEPQPYQEEGESFTTDNNLRIRKLKIGTRPAQIEFENQNDLLLAKLEWGHILTFLVTEDNR